MSTVVRAVGLWGLSLGVLAAGCADDDGDDDSMGPPQGTDASSTAPADDGAATMTTSGGDSSGSVGGAEASSGETGTSAGSSEGGSTSEGDGGSDGTTGEQAFDEEFIWVADFLLGNCVGCHADNANGAIVLPAADISYEEVRVALDGVVANTGLLLVEPFDRTASQTYLQITNEFGAQFPVEDTDRFGDWIDAGAAYYAE